MLGTWTAAAPWSWSPAAGPGHVQALRPGTLPGPAHACRGSRGTHDGEFSPSCEAAAEYWGGEYEDLDGGYSDEAFEAITGKESNSSGEGSLEDVREALKNGPVAGGTEGDGSFLWWDGEMADNRVVPNHAYVVDEVRENANGELEVHVINPWGPGDHKQSDGSNKVGDMWLTQQQWEENFDTLYTTPSTK